MWGGRAVEEEGTRREGRGYQSLDAILAVQCTILNSQIHDSACSEREYACTMHVG